MAYEVEIHEEHEDGRVSIYPATLQSLAAPAKAHRAGPGRTLRKIIRLDTGETVFDLHGPPKATKKGR